MSVNSVEATAAQVRAFRAKRGFLAQDKAPDMITCAHRLMGAQAQVHGCALHAIAVRTQGFPSAKEVEAAMFDAHDLIRTWGQRDTLHLYDVQDLPMIVGSRPLWTSSGRRGGMPSEALLEEMAARFEASPRPLVRSDLTDDMPQAYVDTLRDHPGAGKDPARFAATRVIWMLAQRGIIVFAQKQGREQAYAHRRHWCTQLAWPQELHEVACAQEATRRYLHTFGPATVQDMAHHMGAKITDCRAWFEPIKSECVEVQCSDHDSRHPLYVMAKDIEALMSPESSWPTVLLPAYDTMLMGHRDKRWVLPDEDEEKLVWKKAAVVRATVIDHGMIVATWDHKKRSKHVDITIEPMRGWSAQMRDDVEAQAKGFAAHLGLDLGDLEIT